MKQRINIIIETEDLIDLKSLAKNSNLSVSAYISCLIKIAVSKDISEEPFIVVPEIQFDIINYMYNRLNENKAINYKVIAEKLEYTEQSTKNNITKLIKNGYITKNKILQKGYQVLVERVSL